MSRITKKESLQGLNDVVSSRKIGNNTFEVLFNNGDKAIRLHNTNIITYKNNGNIVLNTDNWKTHTTKSRINQYLKGLTLIQKNHTWFLVKNYQDKNLITYYDSIEFDNNINLITENKTVDTKKQDKIKKQITSYCNLLDKMDKIPEPSSGDCWYCSMYDVKNHVPLGDLTKSDHLISHLKENYLHGSILINAMRESGYKNYQIGLHYQMNLKDTFKRSLRKYLIKRLIK
jgi:hypothetical protein